MAANCRSSTCQEADVRRQRRGLYGAEDRISGSSAPLTCRAAVRPERRRRLLFRVVGYLPGERRRGSPHHDLRAGVAQASREETAANATVVAQGAEAMVIWAQTWPARGHKTW